MRAMLAARHTTRPSHAQDPPPGVRSRVHFGLLRNAQGNSTFKHLDTIWFSYLTHFFQGAFHNNNIAPAQDDEMKPACGPCFCRLLIYTPRHPFIRQALSAVTQNVLSNFTSHRVHHIVYLTGPFPYHQSGVQVVFERNGCDAPAGLPNKPSSAQSLLT